MERLLLKPDEVASALGIGRTKVYELLAAGQLPSVRVGQARRVSPDALREWIKSHESVAVEGRTAG